MSAEATGWVWRHSPFVGSQLLVHLAVADVVNDAHGNEFWMSTSALAEKARVSRSTVVEALRVMVERGLLEVVEAGGSSRRPTVYRLVTSADSAPASAATGLALGRSPVLTRPLSGHALDRSADITRPVSAREPNRTQEPKGTSPLTALADCPRCHGTGTWYNPTSGITAHCPCTRPLPHVEGARR